MIRIVILLLALSACQADESISGFVKPEADWKLISIAGENFNANGTISFPEKGRVIGRAPCNQFQAEQSAPYPWFELGPIMSTKRACPDLAAENLMLQSLAKMTISEVSGDALILSNDAGLEMLFQRTRP